MNQKQKLHVVEESNRKVHSYKLLVIIILSIVVICNFHFELVLLALCSVRCKVAVKDSQDCDLIILSHCFTLSFAFCKLSLKNRLLKFDQEFSAC